MELEYDYRFGKHNPADEPVSKAVKELLQEIEDADPLSERIKQVQEIEEKDRKCVAKACLIIGFIIIGIGIVIGLMH
jgi:hypothetical protein